MVTSSIMSVLHTLSSLIMLAFYLGALAYVISRRTDRSSAKGLAAAALIMMFLLHLGSVLFTFWISRTSSAMDVAMWASLFSIVSSLAYIVSIGMLVAAVFVRRPPADLESLPGGDNMPVNSQNPYSPPPR